jgi:uncharacterized surface protein with fasciclin (FAS1) repeats
MRYTSLWALVMMTLVVLLGACGGDPAAEEGEAMTVLAEVQTTTPSPAAPTGEPTAGALPANEELLTTPSADTNTLITVLDQAGQFGTLLAAIDTAGLLDLLQMEGPYTLLAPTDAAFEQVDTAQLQALLADPEALQQVLLYHVLEGELTATEIADFDEVTTLQTAPLTISTTDDGMLVLNQQVTLVGEQISADNGVIYAIDGLLIPPIDELSQR